MHGGVCERYPFGAARPELYVVIALLDGCAPRPKRHGQVVHVPDGDSYDQLIV